MATGWWVREKPDGTRAPGYAVYLAAGAAALLAIELLHQRLEPPVRHTSPARRRGADVAAVTGAASRMTPVPADAETAAPEARSYRLERPARRRKARPVAPDGADAFDPVAAVLSEEEAASTAGSGFAALAPAWPSDPAAAGGGSRPQGPLLFGYRDPTADERSDGDALRRLDADDRLPRATLVPVILLTTVDTGNPAAVLQFAVSADVIRGGRVRLRFGTRILGALKGAPVRDRLNLAADAVLYPDGSELPMKADAVEASDDGSDIRPGVAATYVPPPAWVRLAPYASDVFTGFTGLLQSRAEQQLSVGVGPVSLQTAAPDDLRGPAYQASGQALQDFVQRRLAELDRRYAAHHVIPAGTACWFQLLEDLDLHDAPKPDPQD